jgi:osmotically inducible protein OsmC
MAAYTIKPLVTATAVNTGGRNGHSQTTDGSVSVDLSVRKEMGGPGLPGTTTPEHLFAAGYAACFGGALELVARQHRKDVSGAVVTCHTSVGPREGGGFGIAVCMNVRVPTLPVEEARALVERRLTDGTSRRAGRRAHLPAGLHPAALASGSEQNQRSSGPFMTTRA